MTLDQLNSLATWVGVVAATLFGMGGLVVGLIGLGQARKATTAAVEANRIADEANQLARLNETRAGEQHDVAWEWHWDPQLLDMVIVQTSARIVLTMRRCSSFMKMSPRPQGRC